MSDPRARTRHGDERGSASLELVIVVPAVVAVIALLTAGWRLWSVRSQVDRKSVV